jgi:hypothetical protein
MATLSVLFMLASITMCSMSDIQRPAGHVKEVIGIVESAGPVEKFSAAAFVRLANGNGITMRVPRSAPIFPGVHVLLTESAQTFGPAKYEFVRVLP